MLLKSYLNQNLNLRADPRRATLDGTLDGSFETDANNGISVLAVQSDGQLLVGGYFTSIGGQARGGLARLASDGSVDPTFLPKVTGTLMSLIRQADGKILASGRLLTLGGKSMNLGRFNSDGSLDTSFNTDANGDVS